MIGYQRFLIRWKASFARQHIFAQPRLMIMMMWYAIADVCWIIFYSFAFSWLKAHLDCGSAQKKTHTERERSELACARAIWTNNRFVALWIVLTEFIRRKTTSGSFGSTVYGDDIYAYRKWLRQPRNEENDCGLPHRRCIQLSMNELCGAWCGCEQSIACSFSDFTLSLWYGCEFGTRVELANRPETTLTAGKCNCRTTSNRSPVKNRTAHTFIHNRQHTCRFVEAAYKDRCSNWAKIMADNYHVDENPVDWIGIDHSLSLYCVCQPLATKAIHSSIHSIESTHCNRCVHVVADPANYYRPPSDRNLNHTRLRLWLVFFFFVCFLFVVALYALGAQRLAAQTFTLALLVVWRVALA